jgi:hypothetical protein
MNIVAVCPRSIAKGRTLVLLALCASGVKQIADCVFIAPCPNSPKASGLGQHWHPDLVFVRDFILSEKLICRRLILIQN